MSNSESLNELANKVLEWLESLTDEELFQALSECDSTIYYAIHGADEDF